MQRIIAIPGTAATRLALAGVAGFLLGCGGLEEKAELPPSDLKADLALLAQSRVWFGHQSVGRDILEGLEALAKENGVSLRIVEAPQTGNGPAGATDTLPGIIHSKVGRNREPASKCEAFNGFVSAHAGGKWDAAAFKFCYVDLGEEAGRDPQKLLGMYKAAVASAKAAAPDLNLVHVTIPLKSDPLGMIATVKRALGMGTANDEDNIARNAFNELLLAEYGKEPFFDLARAESTRPDGARTGFKKDGKSIFILAKEYTYDEGHLSTTGKQWVAADFARAIAAAIRNKPVPAAPAAPADSAAKAVQPVSQAGT